jgi:hypothetical protein
MKRIMWAAWITGWTVAGLIIVALAVLILIVLSRVAHGVGWMVFFGVFLAAAAGEYARQRAGRIPTADMKPKH